MRKAAILIAVPVPGTAFVFIDPDNEGKAKFVKDSSPPPDSVLSMPGCR